MKRKSTLRVAIVAMLAVLAFPLIVAQAQTSQALWSAQYFNNLFLGDPPAFQTTVSEINFDWGNGSPNAAIQNDNWSARFGADVFFNEGTYRFTLRADDEVRLSIDERTIISTLDAGQPGNILTAEVALAGSHKLQIDYREITGAANLSLTWQDVRTVGLTPTPTPTPAPAVPTGLTATVNAAVLNVRSEPTISGVILTKITRNQVYSVVGKNAESTWFKLNVNGQQGWASGAFLTVTDANAVPVVDTAPVSVNPNDVLVRNSVRLNFRSGPATSFESLAVIPARTTLKVVGRNADSSWLRVEYDGRQGWVVLNFVQSVTTINFATIPVSE